MESFKCKHNTLITIPETINSSNNNLYIGCCDLTVEFLLNNSLYNGWFIFCLKKHNLSLNLGFKRSSKNPYFYKIFVSNTNYKSKFLIEVNQTSIEIDEYLPTAQDQFNFLTKTLDNLIFT